ncbi:hypothetical protein [Nonomuraea sp. NPDC049695]|uniref:hypothetical protein n=1 Tax=Nonomuraea sp. NPDC049695 TaxID=3154734 RepID=UPI00343B34BF
MTVSIDPDWPGTSDKDEAADPYADRTEVNRIAGELDELLKKLKTASGIPVTEFSVVPDQDFPDPQLPTGAGSLPDLQQYGALGQAQIGEWSTAAAFAQATEQAYKILVGEPGNDHGKYVALVEGTDKVIDTLYEVAKTSQNAEQATQEAVARPSAAHA